MSKRDVFPIYIMIWRCCALSLSKLRYHTYFSKRDLHSLKQPYMNHTYVNNRFFLIYMMIWRCCVLSLSKLGYHTHVQKRRTFIKTTQHVPLICQKETCIHENNRICTTHMSKRDLYSSKQPNMYHMYVKKRLVFIKTTKYEPHICQKETYLRCI